MKANDIVEFTTPLGVTMKGKVVSVYTNSATGKQVVSIKADNPHSSFDTYGIDIENVRLIKSSSSGEGRLNQLRKSLATYEAKREAMMKSGDALRKKGTFAAIEKTIAYRNQQIEEFLATH